MGVALSRLHRHHAYNGPLNLLPEVTALATTTAAIKEWLGLIVYRYRGWAQHFHIRSTG